MWVQFWYAFSTVAILHEYVEYRHVPPPLSMSRGSMNRQKDMAYVEQLALFQVALSFQLF
jgi:hypothetical protein